MNTRNRTAGFARTAPLRQRGVSLIELMVAMVIGVVLIFGATQVYVNSKNSYGINEGVARMQETARYAMSVMEPDIRLANFWGLLKEPSVVVNAAPQTAAPGAVAPQAAANVCGNNFAIDVLTNLQGDNNGAGGVFLSIGRQARLQRADRPGHQRGVEHLAGDYRRHADRAPRLGSIDCSDRRHYPGMQHAFQSPAVQRRSGLRGKPAQAAEQ